MSISKIKENINTYTLTAFIGELNDENDGVLEMEYNPGEGAILIKDNAENPSEIWITVDCLDDMAKEIKEFSKKLKKLGIK